MHLAAAHFGPASRPNAATQYANVAPGIEDRPTDGQPCGARAAAPWPAGIDQSPARDSHHEASQRAVDHVGGRGRSVVAEDEGVHRHGRTAGLKKFLID